MQVAEPLQIQMLKLTFPMSFYTAGAQQLC